MIRYLVEVVARISGRGYAVDPDIPRQFIITEVVRRVIDFLRGAARFRPGCFFGRNVRVKYGRGLRMDVMSGIGDYSTLDASGRVGIHLARGSKIGRYCTVTGSSQLRLRGNGLRLGENSAIGDFGHVGCSGGVTIGNNVIMGPLVTFHSQEHIFENLDIPIRLQGTRELPIEVGDDVWVGARSTFLAGARVGNGCVVAAGSVVNGQFSDNLVIGGVPAKVIKVRTAQVLDTSPPDRSASAAGGDLDV